MDNRLDTINRELGSKRFKLLVSAGITHKRVGKISNHILILLNNIFQSISEGIEQLRSLRKIGKEGEFKPATYRNNVIKNVINVAERLQVCKKNYFSNKSNNNKMCCISSKRVDRSFKTGIFTITLAHHSLR